MDDIHYIAKNLSKYSFLIIAMKVILAILVDGKIASFATNDYIFYGGIGIGVLFVPLSMLILKFSDGQFVDYINVERTSNMQAFILYIFSTIVYIVLSLVVLKIVSLIIPYLPFQLPPFQLLILVLALSAPFFILSFHMHLCEVDAYNNTNEGIYTPAFEYKNSKEYINNQKRIQIDEQKRIKKSIKETREKERLLRQQKFDSGYYNNLPVRLKSHSDNSWARNSNTLTKTSTCTSCGGDGWSELTDYAGAGCTTVIGKSGCTSCGGSGEEHNSSHINQMKSWGCYNAPRKNFSRGSGKETTTKYISTTDCKSCDGTGLVEYFHQKPFGDLTLDWVLDNIQTENCYNCHGTGKELTN